MLNYQDKEIYLLNLKGQFTATVKLPDEAATNELFRFSFANKMAWLYNVDTRTWTGYQIFD